MQTQQKIEEQTASTGSANTLSAKTISQRILSIVSGALLLGVFVLVGIVALEIIFRLAHIGESESQSPDQTLGSAHIPDKLVTFRMEGFSQERLNSKGLRDVEHAVGKAANIKRIAILGDSATEAMQVALDETFCRQLQFQLNEHRQNNQAQDQSQPQSHDQATQFEVLNFGCAGYSTGQEFLQYKNVVQQYKPDMVVVLYNFSDSAENIFVPQSADKVTPRPVFYLQNNTLAQDDSLIKMNTGVFKPNPVMDFLRRESRIFGVLSQQNLMLSINEPLYVKIKRFICKIPLPGAQRQSTKIIYPAYPLPDATAVTTRIFTELNSVVQKEGGKLIVMTFPNVSNDASFASEEAAVKTTGRKNNFDVLSLTPAFKTAPDYSKLFLKYHFSKDGHAVVAKVLSTFIEQQKY